MKRLGASAAIICSTLLIAGCSGSGDSATETPGTDSSAELSADQVIETFVDAVTPLQSIGESGSDPATQFRQVSDTLTPLVAPLTEGIDGVPEDVTTDAAVAVGALAVSIDLVTECLSTEANLDDCDPLVSNSVTQAQSVGQAMAQLVPYSSWTIDELIAEIS